MKSVVAMIAATVLGGSGICRADDGGPKVVPAVPVPAVAGTKADAGNPPPALAALYEGDSTAPTIGPDFANILTGTVVWRAERSAPVTGQKPGIVIRADVDIPQKLSVRVMLRRNDDNLFLVSHTAEIMFSIPPDFTHGYIDKARIAVGGPRWDLLESFPAKVKHHQFLVGLSSVGADMKRNIQLLKERPIFGIAVVYSDGKQGGILLEKGASGERAFADAFNAWDDHVAPEPIIAAPPPSGPIIYISDDNGGNLFAYYERYRAQVEAGANFRIEGRCYSACALVLRWLDRVCVTKQAMLGFHHVSDPSTGWVTADTRRISEYLLANYPAPVRNYIAAHGGLPGPAGILRVTGSALRDLVKPCE